MRIGGSPGNVFCSDRAENLYVHEEIFRLHGEKLPTGWEVSEIMKAFVRTPGLEEAT